MSIEQLPEFSKLQSGCWEKHRRQPGLNVFPATAGYLVISKKGRRFAVPTVPNRKIRKTALV